MLGGQPADAPRLSFRAVVVPPQLDPMQKVGANALSVNGRGYSTAGLSPMPTDIYTRSDLASVCDGAPTNGHINAR
jgi:hypothetical protein